MTERVSKNPARQGPPALAPEACSQRAARIAADMCVMNTQYFITLDQFISKGELFHLQMHLLYGLIDTMGATADVDPEDVLTMARGYFQSLKRERNETR
jgi:hypothetical protein